MLTHEEAIKLPAVTATTVRATRPWTSNRTKARRERLAKRDSAVGRAMAAADAYMPKAVVTGSASTRKRRTTAPMTTYYVAPLISRMAATNGGNPDA